MDEYDQWVAEWWKSPTKRIYLLAIPLASNAGQAFHRDILKRVCQGLADIGGGVTVILECKGFEVVRPTTYRYDRIAVACVMAPGDPATESSVLCLAESIRQELKQDSIFLISLPATVPPLSPGVVPEPVHRPLISPAIENLLRDYLTYALYNSWNENAIAQWLNDPNHVGLQDHLVRWLAPDLTQKMILSAPTPQYKFAAVTVEAFKQLTNQKFAAEIPPEMRQVLINKQFDAPPASMQLRYWLCVWWCWFQGTTQQEAGRRLGGLSLDQVKRYLRKAGPVLIQAWIDAHVK